MADEPDNETTETESAQPDVSVYEAKIAELNAVIAERDNSISSLTGELTAAKAANYDLLMNVPGTVELDDTATTGDVDSETDTDIDDLFEDTSDSESD